MPRRLSVSVAGAVLASLLALVLHVTFNSPISPLPSLRPSSRITPNNLLKTVDRLGEGRLEGPEAVCVDGEGTLYTATRDGWIKRMQPNGSWEDWKQPGGSALLGIAVSMTGDILVCDADKGLLRVGEDGVATLASEVDGSPIIFADDVVEASDGSVYFSDASTKFGFHDWFLDLLEARPHGRLLRYDPFTKKTYVVLANLTFANGVTLSQDQDFLVVCETWRFRCLKHWLKGEQEGKTEVFIDNLPGGPDNINLAPDGSFWIALLQLRSRWIDWIHCSCMTKRVLATFPKLVEIINPMKSGAMVVNVASNGKITRMLDDSDGTVMSFVTSAMEFDGHLYLGSLQTNFIGKLSLK
ncbi:protein STRICTOSIDINE SYNTHASE-LIKE 4-like [Phoenix dactylifera]|uniref:Protein STRICTOSIDINE SYNTHASE-LIKE 4-like n=1 Tax=Phoenix dactylifera TaxID=42345 RepID=A0A8B7CMS3_PHODC|nr:protein STRICTOSIDINE SYNTHASE-LIKE 4-like [Phoenix dactylifera]